MSKDNFWVIKIPQWDKHNAKQNRQKYYLMDCRMHKDPQFLSLSPGARLAFLWLLGEVATSTRREAWCRPVDLHPITGRKPPAIRSLLDELCSIEWIQILSGPNLSQAKVSKDKISKDKGRTLKKPRDPDPKTAPPEAPPPEQKSLVLVDEPKPEPEKLPTVSGYYIDCWKQRVGGGTKSPDLGPKQHGQLARLSKDHGHRRTLELIRSYFRMTDPFYLKRGYDVGTLVVSIAAINQFEASGKIVTKKVVEAFEEKVDQEQGTDKKPRKSLEELVREREEMYANSGERPKLEGR